VEGLFSEYRAVGGQSAAKGAAEMSGVIAAVRAKAAATDRSATTRQPLGNVTQPYDFAEAESLEHDAMVTGGQAPEEEATAGGRPSGRGQKRAPADDGNKRLMTRARNQGKVTKLKKPANKLAINAGWCSAVQFGALNAVEKQ
jgi:hypothetical protein